MTSLKLYCILLLLITVLGHTNTTESGLKTDTETELLDKEYGVRYASACEVCKYLSVELEDRFQKLGQTSQVIETGYGIDEPKKRVKYTRSEIYFIETLEGVCDGLLQYNIHKERNDSTRFDKKMSQTFKTLHDLVDKGVKVDLGIPEELWDSPSAEITALKQQCEDQLEKHHDIIEQWYWGKREQKLQDYLCRERVLEKDQRSCLNDPTPQLSVEETNSKAQVLSKVHYKAPREQCPVVKKKVKFYDEDNISPDIIQQDSSTDSSEINVECGVNKPTSSTGKASQENSTRVKKRYSDAIVQTDENKLALRTTATQTEESQPFSMTVDDVHRSNLRTFSPVTPIPKNRFGMKPPLRIGLTLRGKKRRVYYPDEDRECKGAEGA